MSPFLLSHPFHLLSSSSLLLLLLFHIPTANGQDKENQKPLNVTCDYTTGKYNKTSPFATNLKKLLTSLSKESGLNENKGFYEGKSGQDNNTVYGQILCRGDSDSTKCRHCIKKANKTILRQCSTMTAVIWYDTCQLRYSNTNFFRNSTNPWVFYLPRHKTVPDTDLDSFRESLGELMYELADEIRAQPRLRNFKTGETNYAGLMTVYGLVQCVPSITANDCYTCLTDAISINIPKCCVDKIGGRVIGPVCGLRFETTHKFYSDSKVEDDSDEGVSIVLILVPVFTGAIILALMVALVRVWSKQGNKAETGNSKMRSLMVALVRVWRPGSKQGNKAKTGKKEPDVKKETGKKEEKGKEEISVEP